MTPPLCASVRVMVRCRQCGQSTGAGVDMSDDSGTEAECSGCGWVDFSVIGAT